MYLHEPSPRLATGIAFFEGSESELSERPNSILTISLFVVMYVTDEPIIIVAFLLAVLETIVLFITSVIPISVSSANVRVAGLLPLIVHSV
ncbi:MAG: hypothetical protein BWX89_00767 [candidate division TA06 bacterium ADurb.Bin131]|uniref:Uncharacterized protein n=1 Tax=candidate division TA06 bacterium ADurb.Bin131 TaxID=1852827 RepID=A0A1V6CAA0_UNCT6|nr:MAG: hypothetical protein BWX89_00767 [candidate division TA06 bacterium ADurb.Bin131]